MELMCPKIYRKYGASLFNNNLSFRLNYSELSWHNIHCKQLIKGTEVKIVNNWRVFSYNLCNLEYFGTQVTKSDYINFFLSLQQILDAWKDR